MRHVTEAPNPLANPAIGKILKDEDTVESYKIEEKGFVVCVVNKVCSLLPISRLHEHLVIHFKTCHADDILK